MVKTLRESGIDISLLTFRCAFYRARAKAAKDGGKGESAGGASREPRRAKAPRATAETGKPPARDSLAVPKGPKLTSPSPNGWWTAGGRWRASTPTR
jgi:hypothetical protein